jgi:hypothetical protein
MVAANDIGAEIATLLTGPAWPGRRVIELGSMVSADEVAAQLGEVLRLDVKAFAVPRADWAEAFEQFGVPKGHTGPAEEMFEAVNAGWMDLGVEGTEHVAGETPARDVFAAAQKAATLPPKPPLQSEISACGSRCNRVRSTLVRHRMRWMFLTMSRLTRRPLPQGSQCHTSNCLPIGRPGATHRRSGGHPPLRPAAWCLVRVGSIGGTMRLSWPTAPAHI